VKENRRCHRTLPRTPRGPSFRRVVACAIAGATVDPSADTTTIRDGASIVVLDAQYWPVVFATWIDEPSEGAVTRYFEANEKLLTRARSSRERFVVVTDTAHTKRPSAKVRKLIADKTNAQPKDAVELTMGSIIVVESALIRGVVTALTWILPRMKDSEILGSISEAIDRALAILDSKGVARPKGLSASRYRRPAA
jgi:hypothetical protein